MTGGITSTPGHLSLYNISKPHFLSSSQGIIKETLKEDGYTLGVSSGGACSSGSAPTQPLLFQGTLDPGVHNVSKCQESGDSYRATGRSKVYPVWSLGQEEKISLVKTLQRVVLGGPVVKNPPSGAGDAGSIPGRGIKISHASEVLSPHTAPREYVLSKACASRQDKLCPSHTHTPQQRLSTTGKKKKQNTLQCPCP